MSLPDGTRISVVHGRPTEVELAAVVAALSSGAAPPDAAVPEQGGPPAWLRAARLEATGHRSVATRADLAPR